MRTTESMKQSTNYSAISRMRYAHQSIGGFTLLELMISIVILAVLFTFAVPSFRELMLNNKMTANVNDVISALRLARAEAIKRDSFVTVCASNAAGNNCATDDPPIPFHQNGWLVISDTGVAGTMDGTDELIRSYPPISDENFTIQYNNGNFVSFNTLGFVSSVSNGTMSFCDKRGNQTGGPINIVISSAGRVRTEHPTAPDCES